MPSQSPHHLRNALVAAATLTALAYLALCVAFSHFVNHYGIELDNQEQWA